MNATKLFLILFLILCSTAVFAQDRVEFKDKDNKLLMQVNDEGEAGSITLPVLGIAPSPVTNKIYNFNGKLYFNGNELGIASGSTPGWIDAGTTVRLTTSTDNVAIGTTTTSAKLEVAGQVKITGGSPGTNKVLTSDATGLATWQTPASGMGGSGTTNYIPKFTAGTTLGNSVIYDNLGKIGIGETSPAAKLEITQTDAANDEVLLIDTEESTGTQNVLSVVSDNGGDENTVLYLTAAGDLKIDGGLTTGGATTTYDDGAITKTTGSALNVNLGGADGDDLIVDTNTLVVESDNNRVGIGTTKPNEQLEITGNFRLPLTTATTGIIKSGTGNLIHTYGSNNFFAGPNAGNLTMTGPGSNMGVGSRALISNTSGDNNNAVGKDALKNNTSGNSNTASGSIALFYNTTGDNNTAVGRSALTGNTTGNNNVGIGFGANLNNETGSNNTIIGYEAGRGPSSHNKSGNVFIGHQAGYNETGDDKLYIENSNSASPLIGGDFSADEIYLNGDVGIGTTPNEQLEITGNFRLPTSTATTGIIKSGGNRFIHSYGTNNFFAGVNAGNLSMTGGGNTAVGYSALASNTSSVTNTALGSGAMEDNTTGSANTAVGSGALSKNKNGLNNIALGVAALQLNLSGRNNVAVGNYALANNLVGEDNIAVGDGALAGNLSSHNIAIGKNAGANQTTGGYNIYIGNQGVTGESYVIRIGEQGNYQKSYIAGVRGITTGQADAVGVLIDSDGQLGTISSAQRYKRDIRNIGDTSQELMQLRPVTFSYKSDATRTTQYGLIAEEVAEVFPELVVYDTDGQPETVRYHLLSSMLLNEVQRLNKKIEELEARINDRE